MNTLDLEHYRRGADILARGSGSATPFIDAVLRGELTPPRLVAPHDVRGPCATIVKLGATGSTRDWSALGKQALSDLLASRGLGLEALGGLACGEINRSQMDRTMAVCAELGVPLVDGEHVGATAVPSLAFCRSVPLGASLTTAYLVVDAHGDELEVVERGLLDPGRGFAGAKQLDDRLRALSGRGGVVAALFFDDAARLYPGSVAHTIDVGRARTLDALRAVTRARVLCSGTLDAVHVHPCTGFSARTIELAGHTIGVMNEFLTVSIGDTRLAEVPDHIVMVDDECRGVLTAQAERFIGRRLHVLSLPLVEPPTADMIGAWRDLVAQWENMLGM